MSLIPTPEQREMEKLLPRLTTQQTTWTEYTGSDEQIYELNDTKNGYIVKYIDASSHIPCVSESNIIFGRPRDWEIVTHYWIIPDDPLREMKIRQPQTGQPVWVRSEDWTIDIDKCGGEIVPSEDKNCMVFYTTTPDWNTNAEYSFTPFEEK